MLNCFVACAEILNACARDENIGSRSYHVFLGSGSRSQAPHEVSLAKFIQQVCETEASYQRKK